MGNGAPSALLDIRGTELKHALLVKRTDLGPVHSYQGGINQYNRKPDIKSTQLDALQAKGTVLLNM